MLLDRPDSDLASTTGTARRNWLIGGQQVDSEGKIAFLIAKSRDDEMGTVVANFHGPTMTVYPDMREPEPDPAKQRKWY